MSNTQGSIARLTETIERLVSTEDLGAVIVHMNDTYLIQEQWGEGGLELPGMARVGALIAEIRAKVLAATGADRTLVLHSGDFLSPSYLANRCETEGRAMVELMNAIGVDFVTLGNHEFDHDARGRADVMARVLGETKRRFKLVSTNLDAPEGFPRLEKLVLWPDDAPFLALVGLAGADTMKVAAKHGFGARPWKEAADAVLASVAGREDIPYLVALTHLDRHEDHRLQDRLREVWRGTGHAHIFGGHDHHMYWLERPPTCTLSKNVSNCATITVSILTNTILGAPSRDWGRPAPNEALTGGAERFYRNENLRRIAREARDTLNFLDEQKEIGDDKSAFIRRIAEGKLADAPDAGWEEERGSIFMAEVERAAVIYSEMANGRRSAAQKEAFLRHLREVGRRSSDLIEYGQATGGHVFERAREFALEDAQIGHQGDSRFEAREQLFWTLHGPDFEAVTPLGAVAASVKRWIALEKARVAQDQDSDPAEVIVDFSSGLTMTAEAVPLEARDAHLRERSTDFGNLVADAVARGTGADVALIHAGSFRLDRRIGPRLTLLDLLNCFIYDDDRAILVVECASKDITAMLDHAKSKLGSGAFLQVSVDVKSVAAKLGRVRIAIAAWLLESPSDQDGYQAALAQAQGLDWEEWVPQRPEALSCHSLIQLCRDHLPHVAYNTTSRLEAQRSLGACEAWMEQFILAVDGFAAQGKAAGLDLSSQTSILANPGSHFDKIEAAGQDFTATLLTVRLQMEELLQRDFDELQDHVARFSAVTKLLNRHERRFTMKHDYAIYLASAFEHVVQTRLDQIREDERQSRT